MMGEQPENVGRDKAQREEEIRETQRREVSENSLEALENTKQSTQDVYFILPSSVPCYHVTSLLIKGEVCYHGTRQQVTEKERMREPP